DILDEQRKVGKEVLSQPPPADLGSGAKPLPAMPLPGAAPLAAAVSGSTSSPNRTRELSDPDLASMEVKDLPTQSTMIMPGGSDGNGAAPLAAQSTQILGAQHVLPVPMSAAGGGGARPASTDLPAQSTMILDASTTPIIPPSGPVRATAEA